jgi:hypothetical protein
MTKTIKMSLAAVVAVAGFSTSASAIDYSGKLYVEHYGVTQNNDTDSGFEIDFDVTATSKITDNFSATVGVEADSDNKQTAVGNANVSIDDAYIAYNKDGLGVKVGRQGMDTPNTDGDNGEGTMVTYGMGNITVAGAFFDNHAIVNGTENIMVGAVLGSADMVNFEAWMVNIDEHSSNMTLAASANVGPVTVAGRYATSSFDAAGEKDGDTMKLTVSGKVENISLTGIYLANGEDNAALTTDASSANTVELVKLHASNRADTTVMAAVASMGLTDGYSVALKYGAADVAGTNYSEMVAQLNKSFAKNLKGSLRYSDYDDTSADGIQIMRADIKYSF